MPANAFEKLIDIMHRLRKECPWDKEQTPESLRQYILEEAYETIEAIDRGDWDELKKELGDLLLQVVFQAEIAEEKARFTLTDVIQHINQKLIERHPHVFGSVSVRNSEEVRDNWERIKYRAENRKSVLEGVPISLSGLLRAQRIQDKASQVGFDWDNVRAVLEKVEEEINELKQSQTPAEQEEEIGDLFFALVNFCRFQKISAEDALRKTTEKFIFRFRHIEKRLIEQGKAIHDASLEEMETLWQEAKNADR